MDTYNGWRNYETWLVALHWADCLSDERREEQEETGEDIQWNVEQIKDLVWEREVCASGMSEDANTVAMSMFRSAWRIVDWDTIAEHVNED